MSPSSPPEPVADVRICVAIPIFAGANMGASSIATVAAGTLFALGRQLHVMCGDSEWADGPIAIEPAFTNGSFEHSRSDLVHRFLKHPSKYTHLLFWDSDVVAPVGVVAKLLSALLRTKRDFVGVPYALKVLDWPAVARTIVASANEGSPITVEDLASAGLRYSPDFRKEWRGPIEPDDCAEMHHVPLGFALLKREVLQRMVECYSSTLTYRRSGEELVCLFKTVLGDTKQGAAVTTGLLDEDFAFAERWGRIGGKQHIYMGEGSPLGHVGTYVFQGTNAHVRHVRNVEGR